LGQAALQKDYLPLEINQSGICSFFAIFNFMIYTKSTAKAAAKHEKPRPKKHRPCSLKQEKNYRIQNSPARIYIELTLI
jgi:hypothetical protein